MIDHHAHPFDRRPVALDLTAAGIDLAELGSGPQAHASPLWRALLLGRLARRFGVEHDEVPAARDLAAGDYPAYVRGLFADAGITAILMDPGWPPGSERHAGELAALSGCAVHLLWRVDPLIDDLLAAGAGDGELVDRVEAALVHAHADGYRGLKSVIAYRSGLAVDPDARPDAGGPALSPDRRHKALRDLVLRRTLGFAADTGMPVQIHTGFGDSDLRLGAADPLLLEGVLDSAEGRAATVVLLHAGFPFVDHAAYLAAARANVHVDLSLVNLFAPARVGDTLLRLASLAPPERILLGTDAYGPPELYWFAATLLRESWRHVAGRLGRLGVPEGWTRRAEGLLFAGNARRLYRLEDSAGQEGSA
jgi:hypothetical protein